MKKGTNRQALKHDRRTLKTKKFLVGALTELIIEKGYDAITIQDIIDRANVGRSTFYSHYESKEQLFIGNINFQDALINIPLNDDEHYPMGINLGFLFSKEYLPLSKAMSGTKSSDMLFNMFTEICAAKILIYNKRRFEIHGDQKLMVYKAEAAAAGIIRMLFKWLEDGALVPPEKMIGYAREILEKIG